MKIEIYTDGSCFNNPGPGGYGICLVINDKLEKEHSGGINKTTNNIMELTAVLKSFQYSYETLVTIYSDSQYVVKGYNEWIENWVKNKWTTSAKKPVANQNLWKELYKLKTYKTNYKLAWVKAHNGNKYNELADILAKNAAKQYE